MSGSSSFSANRHLPRVHLVGEPAPCFAAALAGTPTSTAHGALHLLFARSWAEGRRLLRGVAEPERTLLCVDAPPPPSLGENIAEAGGLSWWGPGAPTWVLELAHAALGRMQARSRSTTPLPPDHPDLALRTGIDLLGRSLGAEQVQIWILDPNPRPADGSRPLLSAGLVARARGQILAIPHLSAAPLARGEAPGAAVLVPLGADRSLLFRWSQPRLLHPQERAEVAQFSTLLHLAAAWRSERTALSQAHRKSLQALGNLHLSPSILQAQSPAPSSATAEWESGAPQDTEAAAIQSCLHARLGLGGLAHLYARARSSSRGEAHWLSAESERPSPGVMDHLENLLAEPDPVALPKGGHALSLRGTVPVVGIWHSPAEAELGRETLREVAADLRLALRLYRQAAQEAVLRQISSRLAEVHQPNNTLAQILGLVARTLDADGAKVILVVDARGTPLLRPFIRTDAPTGTALLDTARGAPLEPDRGLADTVVREDDHLLVGPHHPGESAPTHSGRGLHRSIHPRPIHELWERPGRDPERVQLLVPLHHAGAEVVGVLAVWRSSPEPFLEGADVEALRAMAPHVSSACARLIEQEQVAAELDAITTLTAETRPERGPREVEAAVLTIVGRLSGCRHALLLRDDGGTARIIGVWSHDPPAPRTARLLADAAFVWGEDPATWPETFARLLDAYDPEPRDLPNRLQQLCTLSEPGQTRPYGAIALLRSERPAPLTWDGPALGVPRVGRLAAARVVDTFCRFAAIQLARHRDLHTRYLLERLGQSTDPLRAATDLLAGSFGPRTLLLRTRPVSGRQCICEGAFTGLPLTAHEEATGPVVLNELRAETGFPTPSTLSTLSKTVGWRPRSAALLPIAAGHLPLGALALFTHPEDPPLDPANPLLASTLLSRAAELTVAAEKGRREHALAELVRSMTGATPGYLATELPSRVATWLEGALHRPCEVAIVAFSGHHPVLEAAEAAIEEKDRRELVHRSRAEPNRTVVWARPERLTRRRAGTLEQRRSAVGAPLQLAVDAQFTGHLWALRAAPFHPEETELVAEAARELSVLLHGEVIRQAWKRQEGLFRHAIVGPLQGIRSACQTLGALTLKPDPTLQSRALRILDREIAAVSAWSVTQKYVAMIQDGQTPTLDITDHSLADLIEPSFSRFSTRFAEAGRRLRQDFQCARHLPCPTERDAVAFILDNLLDNALKYGWKDHEVVLQVAQAGTSARISVQSRGAPIPPELEEAIYAAGVRGVGAAGARAIAGEGMGLYLSRLLARAQGGDLGHTVEDGVPMGDRPGPARIRFSLRLPLRTPES